MITDRIPAEPLTGRETAEKGRYDRLWRFLAKLGGSSGRGAINGLLDELERSFARGFQIADGRGETWFATLDAVQPEAHEVIALIRVSSTPPAEPKKLSRGPIFVESRDRRNLTDPTYAADSDILLTFAFPGGVSFRKSLECFAEFARNELSRNETPVIERPALSGRH